MNKRLLCIISIVMTLGVNSMAVDFMGPPTAGLKEGQWKMGYTFHYSENDLLADFSSFSINGVEYKIDSGDVKIDAVKVARNYFTLNYGLVDDRMEIYGFIGCADTKADTGIDIFSENLTFNGNNDYAFGIGTKVTTNKYDNADWGVLIQASWLKSADTLGSWAGVYEGHTYSAKYDVEFRAYELQIAVGPTIKVMEGWKVYGGPFVYVLHGDLKEKLSGTVDGEPGYLESSGHLKQDNGIGGYIGTQIELFKNAAIGAEYASTGTSTGFGVNISWTF